MPPSQDELRQLQEAMLKAILFGHRLPGGIVRLHMPDLHFVTSGKEILLLDENLQGPLLIGDAGKPVRLLSRVALQAPLEVSPQTAYLTFLPVEIGQDLVRMTLEARLLRPSAGGELGLSSVGVVFRKTGGTWIAEVPTFGAM